VAIGVATVDDLIVITYTKDSVELDLCGLLDGLEYGIQRILHWQYEACSELPKFPARIHDGGRILKKFNSIHRIIECLGHLFRLSSAVQILCSGNRVGNPSEHVFRGLCGPTRRVLNKVSLSENKKLLKRQFLGLTLKIFYLGHPVIGLSYLHSFLYPLV